MTRYLSRLRLGFCIAATLAVAVADGIRPLVFHFSEFYTPAPIGQPQAVRA